VRRLAVALALLLGACASRPVPPPPAAPPLIFLPPTAPIATAAPPAPAVRTVTVKTPAAAPCRVTLKEPEHPDTAAALRAAPSAEDRYQLIAAGRQVWIAWTKELEAALRKCGGAVSNR
jgi:hypothetical protein